MTISKTKIDEAARRLAKSSSASVEDDERLIDLWRQLHAEPLQKIREAVARRLGRAEIKAPVVGRLKRKPQIVKKLSVSSTRLTQMQDVGGCRAVLLDPEAVNQAEVRIRSRSTPWYEITSVSDYRDRGRTGTGYRALHLVATRDERFVEIQLRTRRQHAWAEGVERVATLLECGLKRGEGPEEAVQFFERASDSFWILDTGGNLTRSHKKDLRSLKTRLDEILHDSKTSDSTSTITPKRALARGTNLWLVIYNWREANFERWMDLGTNSVEASATYSRYEREYLTEEGYEVVLIGADSPESFEVTHSHYFARNRGDIDPHGHFKEVL